MIDPSTHRIVAMLGAASLLVIAGCLPGEAGGLRFGDPLPHFAAKHLATGDSVSLSDYRGHTLLVNLWATWCVPCRTETPYLQSLYEEYEARGLRIVGISVDQEADLEAVASFAQEMGVSYDILLDPAGASERTFRARGLPNSVLVDRDGVVVFSWLGPIEEGDPDFLAGLQQALSRSPRPTSARAVP